MIENRDRIVLYSLYANLIMVLIMVVVTFMFVKEHNDGLKLLKSLDSMHTHEYVHDHVHDKRTGNVKP